MCKDEFDIFGRCIDMTLAYPRRYELEMEIPSIGKHGPCQGLGIVSHAYLQMIIVAQAGLEQFWWKFIESKRALACASF